MQVISKASASLNRIISPVRSDLVWSMLLHPVLVSSLAWHFANKGNVEFPYARAPCANVDKVGILQREALLASCDVPEKADNMVFDIFVQGPRSTACR
ncbi:hypothetical protein O9K51_09700 [Purpureocillium lavendulum]|uniref:Uncharacterized protein n=1 Tax=Purpureocillium lavendulum TaxID=1247861 RepID=A0AB34FFP5_9HYPO|nr:hypothetical protein O9K51_09700 [Purpureocillium lavendulum]